MTAKPITPKIITIVILEDFLSTALFGALDLLNTANLIHQYKHRQSPKLFEWKIVSTNTGIVKASNGYEFNVKQSIDQVKYSDVIYIPGVSLASEKNLFTSLTNNKSLYPWLRTQVLKDVLIATSCTGSIYLAEAGILKNKKITTSWMFADYFRRNYPDIDLSEDEILIDSRSIITSGAASSYQELILEIIKKMAGRELTMLVAKFMLVDKTRTSQAAYKVTLPTTFDLNDPIVISAIEHIRVNHHKNISINELADHLCVSYRTLIRKFKTALGISINSYIQNQRIESSKKLMELTQLTLDEIVYKVGYNDVSAFRKLFKRSTNMTPRIYKQKFGIN